MIFKFNEKVQIYFATIDKWASQCWLWGLQFNNGWLNALFIFGKSLHEQYVDPIKVNISGVWRSAPAGYQGSQIKLNAKVLFSLFLHGSTFPSKFEKHSLIVNHPGEG